MKGEQFMELSFTSFERHLFLDDVTEDQSLIYYYWNQNSIGVTNVGVAFVFSSFFDQEIWVKPRQIMWIWI